MKVGSPPLLRSLLSRPSLAALLIAVSPGALAAQASEFVIGPAYEDIVRRYAVGEHGPSIAALGSWSRTDLRRNLSFLTRAADGIRKCSTCSDARLFSRFPLRAAILLHADRELLEQIERPLSEHPPRCGIGPQAQMMEGLASIQLLLEPQSGVFVRRVYLAMARHAQWSHCVLGAQEWARRGLLVFPKDVPLLMALGLGAEAQAFYTLAPSSDTIGLSSLRARQRMEMVAAHRGLWAAARRAFEDVIATDPGQSEARLRLGRVLWRLEQLDASRTCFEAVLTASDSPDLVYLAHLFLGRVLEDKDEHGAAEEHYRAALKMQPLSEVAAVALSHIRFLQGDSDSAREILRAGMTAVLRRADFDPWTAYEITQTPDGELLLATLRQEIHQ